MNRPTHENAVAQFMDLTNTQDITTVRNYIEMCGGDLEAALALYFDEGAKGHSDTATPSTKPEIKTLQPPQESDSPSAIGALSALGDSISAFLTQSSSSQSQFDSNSSSSTGGRVSSVRMSAPGERWRKVTKEQSVVGGFGGMEEVRAPDPSYSQTLIGDSGASAYAKSVAEPTVDTVNSMTSHGVPRDDGDRAFTELFAPPTDINYTGTFASAREFSKENNKLLLVNIQKEDVFACHKLNRDIWSTEGVRNMITHFFSFWQRSANNPEGNVFCDLYKVANFPHIAAIDPRTGRCLKIWSSQRFAEPLTALSELMEFLEKRDFGSSVAATSPNHTICSSLPTDVGVNFSPAPASSSSQSQQPTSSISSSQPPSVKQSESLVFNQSDFQRASHGTTSVSPSISSPKQVMSTSSPVTHSPTMSNALPATRNISSGILVTDCASQEKAEAQFENVTSLRDEICVEVLTAEDGCTAGSGCVGGTGHLSGGGDSVTGISGDYSGSAEGTKNNSSSSRGIEYREINSTLAELQMLRSTRRQNLPKT